MIRVNLLPTKAVVKGTSIRTQLIAAGVIVLLFSALPILWSYSLNSQIEELNAEIAKKEKELREVKEARSKLDKIKKLNQSLKRKLDVINDIEKKRTGPVWLMDQIADALTRFPVRNVRTGNITYKYLDDRIFLDSMKVTGKDVTITGLAINNTYLVAFLNNLRNKSDLFSSVKLVYSDEEKYKGGKVRKFKITCKVNLSAEPRVGGPAAAPEPEEAPEENGGDKTASSKGR